MTSSWVWPAIAGVLIWTPLASTLLLRRSGETRKLSWAPSARALISYWPNWIDLLRCIIAMAILVNWGSTIRLEDPSSGKLVLGTIMAVTMIGFFMQTILVATRRTLFAPLPLFLACAILIPGWDIGVFAVLVTWALCAATKKFDLIFPILAGILMLGGIVLNTSRLDLVVAVFLVAFPQIFALMFSRRLVLPSNVILSH